MIFTLVAAAGLVAGCATEKVDKAAAEAKTEVVFDHPENFTDVKDAWVATDKGRDAILSNLREHLVERAARFLPEGYKLKVVFTDIDLAGEFEPWHGPAWQDVRIIRSTWPPAFKFTYTVTDPSGKVALQGAENIRDVAFEQRLVGFADDSLRYEKGMIDDWVYETLRGLKKT